MRAAEVTEFGGPEVFRVVERPEPVAGAGEVVVNIHAATINPTDMGTRAGQAKRRLPDLEPPFVPGWDLAGERADTGERVVGMIPFVAIGGRVGSYAEAAAVDPDWLAPLDDGVSFDVGATLPLNALTANEALERLALPAGSRLLVTGASGAVGGFATQLAVRDGIRVLAQASTDDEDWVASLGAAELIPRSADLAGIGTVDAVLDAVPIGPASTTCLRDGGMAVFTRPPRAEPDRDMRFETVLVQTDPESLRGLARDLADGGLRTRVAEVLPLARAARAHELNEAGGLRGKVVLTP
jgi:NADPH:quinone reductase